jgi:hypothetical protein
MDETIAATGDNSKPFTAAFDHLLVGKFNDEFGVRDREVLSNGDLIRKTYCR